VPCHDCSSGQDNPFNDGPDFDTDGLCDSSDPDIDGDGRTNPTDTDDFNRFICGNLVFPPAGDDCCTGTLNPAACP
jgi:hypothetical protein